MVSPTRKLIRGGENEKCCGREYEGYRRQTEIRDLLYKKTRTDEGHRFANRHHISMKEFGCQ